ncbi:MAG: type II toxin-antitoxin system VapC family toxin [Deltaproteobacteria bacterium]|nr:type II toxin-antitoxin system VapC family toxin [Deltaproteobacteria bacterium]
MRNRIVVFDTSVLVDQFRTNRHAERMRDLAGIVRSSSVVLSELLRGATTKQDRDLVAALARNHPILVPMESNWLESGAILSKMREDQGFPPGKLRDLHFDVLIALTARSHGATLITSNATDFGMIRKYRDFRFEAW